MDKREQVTFILAEKAHMDEKNRNALAHFCQTHWGYDGGMTEAELLERPDNQLELLHNVMQGMKLTREYVPDIIQAYETVDRTTLSNRVSFGLFGNDRT